MAKKNDKVIKKVYDKAAKTALKEARRLVKGKASEKVTPEGISKALRRLEVGEGGTRTESRKSDK